MSQLGSQPHTSDRQGDSSPEGSLQMPAKQKEKRSKLQTASTPSSSKAQHMVDRLRQQYALGRDAVEAQKNGTSTEEFGAVHNYSGHMMRKMKVFARHYSPEDLNAHCQGRRPNGLPLHWGYIPVLLAVESKHGKAERERFQRLAIVEGGLSPSYVARSANASMSMATVAIPSFQAVRATNSTR